MSPLLDRLPPELRLIIYEFAFTTPDEVDIYKIVALRPQLDLLLTCRQIHNEAHAVYKVAKTRYRENSNFVILVRRFLIDYDLLGAFLQSLPPIPKAARILPKLAFRFMELPTNRTTSSPYSSDAKIEVEADLDSDHYLKVTCSGTGSIVSVARDRLELTASYLRAGGISIRGTRFRSSQPCWLDTDDCNKMVRLFISPSNGVDRLAGRKTLWDLEPEEYEPKEDLKHMGEVAEEVEDEERNS